MYHSDTFFLKLHDVDKINAWIQEGWKNFHGDIRYVYLPRRFKVNYVQPIPKVRRGNRFSNIRPRHFSFTEGKFSLFQHNYDVLIYLNITLLKPLVARYYFLGEQSGPCFFFVIQIQRWRDNSITIKLPNKNQIKPELCNCSSSLGHFVDRYFKWYM